MNVVRMLSNYKGVSLVETLAVITILAILIALATPIILNDFENANLAVCETNRIQLLNDFYSFLIKENRVESGLLFSQYLVEYDGELCPSGGDLDYIQGKIYCSIHTKSNNIGPEDKDNIEIPYL